MASTNRILLTGATGYVGGTVLDHLTKSQDPSIKVLTIDLLVRSDDAAAKLRQAYGDRVNTIQWPGGLSNVSFIADTAANYDLIINTGSGFVADGAKAFVQGLARRVESGKPAPWLLHIGGCTSLGDRPITQPEKAYPDREWDDTDGAALYALLHAEEVADPYPQRTTELGVLAAAEEAGVSAISLNTPCIFGEGTGLFNKQGIIIPTLMRYVVQHGHGFKLTETANFDWVHVEDLADVYVLLAQAILKGDSAKIPSGKKGLIFPATGRSLQTEIFQHCLDAAFDLGVLPREGTPKTKEIRQATLQQIADEITFGILPMAERGWAGNKAQKGTVAKNVLGWKPRFLEEAWKKDFKDELVALKEGRRGVTMESCIGQT